MDSFAELAELLSPETQALLSQADWMPSDGSGMDGEHVPVNFEARGDPSGPGWYCVIS